MLYIFGIILYITHLFACIWYYSAKQIQNLVDNTWVARNGALQETPSRLYLMSYYWAFQTISTVGFGDFNAGNDNTLEQCIAIAWMIIGVGYYSYAIGNVNQLIEEFDRSNEDFLKKMDSLKQFQLNNKVPVEILKRIRRQLENSKDQKKFTDNEEFLHSIPSFLRDQVVTKTHG